MDIYDHDQGRILCAGGQNGELCVGVYNLSGVETASYSTRLFSPISSVKIYNSRSPITSDNLNDGDSIDRILQDESETNIVVTCAVERAIIYQ
jgi:KICSTOR complex protein kaptin